MPTNEELIAKYSSRVSNSIEKRLQHKNLWDRLSRLYSGDQWADCANPPEEQATVNFCWSTINTIMASTSIRNPSVLVNPLNAESAKSAKLISKILSHDWEVHGWQSQIQLAVKDSLIFGFGVCKVRYEVDEVYAKLSPSGEIDTSEITKIVRSASLGSTPRRFMNRVTDSEIQEYATKSAEHFQKYGNIPPLVADEFPVIQRVSPYDILVDPAAQNFGSSSWIAQRSRVPIDWAQANKSYSSSARDQLSGSKSDEEIEPHVWIVEMYDMAQGTMCVFAEKSSGFLVAPKPMPMPFGSPFVILENEDDPKSVWPIGELQQIEGLQRELNLLRSDLSEDRQRANGKMFMPQSLYDNESAMEAIKSNKKNVIVPYSEQDLPAPGRGAIFYVDTPSVRPELYPDSALIQNDINFVSGISDFQRGVAANSGTATEAAIINDASQSRIALKLAKIERFMEDAAAMAVILYQTFTRRDRIIRFAGGATTSEAEAQNIAPGEAHRIGDSAVAIYGDLYMTAGRADLAGQFDFKVEAGSSRPHNATQARQAAQQVLAAAMPFIQSGLIDMEELLRYVFEVGFGIPNADRILVSQPTSQPASQPTDQSGTPPGGATPLGGQVGPAERDSPIPVIR